MEEKEKKEPQKISKEEADKMQDFAQGLDDEITHTVDYGDLDNEDKK
jgi:hypothetical protein|tara:strand:+ start:481 stop:621 length:141 start_codon:yes stop_codon:yes gene_type:complete